ncbi:hypothetical protein predicted by Glimmer/Critica [Salmonella enterica subsp. enterica serovar Weltevreden str. 2007-60-3289-1]|nr:hypothetical protein predicted by Glimmer/Critica [Salmonella enterica subsp. enterica serovar Weltevreden str. 2007-60-3289-1]
MKRKPRRFNNALLSLLAQVLLRFFYAPLGFAMA